MCSFTKFELEMRPDFPVSFDLITLLFEKSRVVWKMLNEPPSFNEGVLPANGSRKGVTSRFPIFGRVFFHSETFVAGLTNILECFERGLTLDYDG